MKKIIIITMMVLLIPFLVVQLFIRDDKIKFEYKKNTVVRVKREKTGQIEKVPFESYVAGVLAGEMPTTFPMEALKAQAVAARTYVMRKMEYAKEQDYDIVDTVSNQVYYNDEELKTRWKDTYTEKINRIKTAVLETKGEYIAYHGEIAQAFFFSTSTGVTENCEEVFQESLPYLKSVKSDWEKDVSPVFEDSKTFTLKDFYSKLNLYYNSTLTVNVTAKTTTGRIKNITINGKNMTGNEVYKALGLRSTFFDIQKDNETVIVKTRGFGHGVGMSQYGAYGMAKQGADYQKILKYYYQGVDIKKTE